MNQEMPHLKNNGPEASQLGILSSPGRDFLASVFVFLVALPLCMGIAIASGVPVAAGLITGIVLSAVKLLHKFSHLKVKLDVQPDKTVLSLIGAATFIKLPRLADALERVPEAAE